jgi:superfamily II DNA or RNA helicase
VFSQFGLTIIDECHHIAAEVFCRALFKIVTPNMLGLSATMNRKDGLTRVFKMFLGDVVYSEKREGGDGVLVRCVQYKSRSEEFNETVLNFKGQPHYSLMISKLCAESHRTEMILRVLRDMRAELPERQIMVLAHNKNVLKYIHDAVECRKIGTVGYYVGGMKEEHLKETESKEVVIATYAMAEEALDIKTLSALVLVTPKTDVTQAVGRILRMKHEFPVVVDIVDPHDIFQRQWLKRRSFYAKCGYTVVETTSDKYLRAANPLDLVKDDEDGEEGEEGEDAEDTSALSGAGAGAGAVVGAVAGAVEGACAITPDESIWRTVYKEGKRAEEFKKKLEDDEKPPLLRGKCLINIKTD